MRTIKPAQITEAVSKAVIDANYYLPYDVVKAVKAAAASEKNKKAKNALYKIAENYKIAKNDGVPLCQDTGLAVVFTEIGSEVKIEGSIYAAIDEGVKKGYAEGYLRKSTASPLTGKNFFTNTPAIIHTKITPGARLKMHIMAKGAGAENKSALAMLTPAAGEEGIIDFIIDTVKKAGASACPPYIIGVGLGGNFETAPLLAKKSLLRKIGAANKDKKLNKLEKTILDKINSLGIGALGLGGKTTALAVHIESAPRHIASLPVAVNIQCHSSRHKTINL